MLYIDMAIALYIPSLFGASIEVYFILLSLGLPTFFLWRWLVSKFIKDQRIRTIATWVITILTTPMLYVGLVMLLLFSLSYHPTYSFDQEKWFANKRKRYELSEDIIERKMLLGKTKSEVRQLLGDEGNTNESDHWTYQLGMRPGLTILDPDVLAIEFSNGKVSSVKQYES
ncbi:hypothetical protein [Fibrella aestuarina]|uniref:hypothetical protein n=1 Tax=Fibrella aestuarina TaxID=651143 RepID=UPI000688B4B3|nr:hypothetical protein [Fibrella aestuarina]